MITENEREILWQQVDFALAMQGEDIDPAAARRTFDELLATSEEELLPNGWPKAKTKQGEQTTIVTRVAMAVLDAMGQAPPDQVVHAVPDLGKWDDKDGAPEIIRKPIGG